MLVKEIRNWYLAQEGTYWTIRPLTKERNPATFTSGNEINTLDEGLEVLDSALRTFRFANSGKYIMRTFKNAAMTGAPQSEFSFNYTRGDIDQSKAFFTNGKVPMIGATASGAFDPYAQSMNGSVMREIIDLKTKLIEERANNKVDRMEEMLEMMMESKRTMTDKAIELLSNPETLTPLLSAIGSVFQRPVSGVPLGTTGVDLQGIQHPMQQGMQQRARQEVEPIPDVDFSTKELDEIALSADALKKKLPDADVVSLFKKLAQQDPGTLKMLVSMANKSK